MAKSTCPKNGCGGTRFEAVPAQITGTHFPYMFIQCSSCGTVVGTSEAHYVPQLMQELAKSLNVPPLK
jgi:hypothetical protein